MQVRKGVEGLWRESKRGLVDADGISGAIGSSCSVGCGRRDGGLRGLRLVLRFRLGLRLGMRWMRWLRWLVLMLV